jgi:hypothetical protein
VVPCHATIGPVDQVPRDSDQEEQRSRLLVAARVGDRNLSRGIVSIFFDSPFLLSPFFILDGNTYARALPGGAEIDASFTRG